MKKNLVVFLLVILASFFSPLLAYATENNELNVYAKAYVVMDEKTGQILLEKDSTKPKPIASTTKIMTALVALKCGNLEKISQISSKASNTLGSSMNLQAGEKLSLEELLYGALMRSGNDACVAISENVALEEEIFVAMMNKMSNFLGLKNTHFSNTNGLPNNRHVSSAYDLALISRYALQNPTFAKIVSTKNKTIDFRELKNTNKLLWDYPGADGVKTGTTNAAGKCLVSSATQNGQRLIAVVLNSPDRYNDCIKLLDFGFENFSKSTLFEKGDILTTLPIEESKEKALLTTGEDLSVYTQDNEQIEWKISTDTSLSVPFVKDNPVGKIEIIVDGKLAKSTYLYPTQSILE